MTTENPEEMPPIAPRDRELERAYAQATDQEREFADFDCTSADGLDEDSAW